MMYINYITDKERWEDVIDGKIKEIYQISDYGRIRNKVTGYILNTMISHDGYCSINLQKKDSYKGNCKRRIHRLVLQAFNPIEMYREMEGHHVDGNKLDNTLINLRWTTKQEHVQLTRDMKLLNIAEGEKAPNAKYSNFIASQVCVLLKQNYNVADILQKIGLDNTRNNKNFIRNIRNMKIYKNISKPYKLPVHSLEKLPYDVCTVMEICSLLEKGEKYKDICESLKLPHTPNTISNISSIRRGKTFKEISSMYKFPKTPLYQRRNPAYVELVCQKLEEGKPSIQILNELGVSKNKNELHFISKIRNHLSFQSITRKYNI